VSAFDGVLPDTAPYNRPAQDTPPEWVASLLDGLVSALRPTASGDTSADEDPPEIPDPLYAGPEEWVTGWLAPIIVRQPTQDFIWCASWWDHPEVLTRITGLWESWETARLGGATAINDWLATQLDHHLTVITTASGPFFRCKPSTGDTPGEHHTPAGLGLTPAPDGFFGPATP